MCDAAGTLNKLWQIWNQSKYIVRSFTWNLIQFHACLADTVEAKDSIYVSLDAFIDKELQKETLLLLSWENTRSQIAKI
jgi:hypothetical protein